MPLLLSHLPGLEACFLTPWNSIVSSLIVDIMNVLVTYPGAARGEEMKPEMRWGSNWPSVNVQTMKQQFQPGLIPPASAIQSNSIFSRSEAKDSTVWSMIAFCLNYHRDKPNVLKEEFQVGRHWRQVDWERTEVWEGRPSIKQTTIHFWSVGTDMYVQRRHREGSISTSPKGTTPLRRSFGF